MYESHNPMDVDMAALKKGEIDLGTSMYRFPTNPADILAWQSNSEGGSYWEPTVGPQQVFSLL